MYQRKMELSSVQKGVGKMREGQGFLGYRLVFVPEYRMF